MALAVIGSQPPAGGNNCHFSDALQALTAATVAGQIDLGTISQFMGSRSIGALLLFFALPMAFPVPAVGISVLFGIPLTVISAQLLLGRRYAWLPARLASYSVAQSDLCAYITRAQPVLHRIEDVLRPRIAVLTSDPAMRVIGAACLVLALIITLPIPFGHMVPGLAISAMALGVIERDGLAVAIGLAITLFALLIVVLVLAGFVAAGRAFI